MARKFDGPLSEKDIKFLRTRHSAAYVDRLVTLHGTDDSAKAEPEEPEETPEDAGEGSGEPEGHDGTDEGEEDLIGSAYDPLAHTTNEVRAYLKTASVDELNRVKAIEQERTDREARTSIVNYNPPS